MLAARIAKFAGAAALVASLLAGSAAEAADKVRLILDWAWLPYHAAFLYARDKGYFAAEGLDYEFRETMDSSSGRGHQLGSKVGAYQTLEA